MNSGEPIAPELLRRSADICLSTILAPVAVLMVSIGAVALYASERGPLFYCQTRIGRHGQPFTIFKLRSMRPQSESLLSAAICRDPEVGRELEAFHKLRQDPRVTRVGQILRRYSIDELPQLWNVVRGEMSIVGPRPYLPGELQDTGPSEALITSVKPGLTGLWQVRGRHCATFVERVQLDCQYVRSRGLALDLVILLLTVPALIRGTGR